MASDDEQRLRKLSDRMRSDWDRRIQNDYRFWMGDGVADDAAMWSTGARDFEIITEGILGTDKSGWTVLEVGCGVGRLLRSAASHFNSVIGVDVSKDAIDRAAQLLDDLPNVRLHLTDGLALAPVPDRSIDLAYSFAAISHMPAPVFAQNLAELARVVKPGGVLRLQVYLGREQEICEEDTLAPRGYAREMFVAGCQAAGFELEGEFELKLPFEASDRAAGLIATVVSLRRAPRVAESAERIGAALVQFGEQPRRSEWPGSKFEYLMAVSQATYHLEAGNMEKARVALEFAVSSYAECEEEVLQVLKGLRESAGASEPQRAKPFVSGPSVSGPQISAPAGLALADSYSSELLEKNLRVLSDRFPSVHAAVIESAISNTISVMRAATGEPVLVQRGLPSDNPEKPVVAADNWASRSLAGMRIKNPSAVVVFGFSGGYHIEALLRSELDIHVLAPSVELLKAACSVRDLTGVLKSISSLSVSVESFREQILPQIDSASTDLIVHPQAQAASGQIFSDFKRAFFGRRAFTDLHPNIAVVGPMYGGSLPIARYTASAVVQLGQRMFGYDLSEYYKGFAGMQSFLRNPQRVSALQNQYVEMLSSLVLEGINERPVDIVICLAQAPLSPRVLTELRQRGIITVMWFVEDCLRFKTWKELSPYFDYMFLIQEGQALKNVEAAGAGRAIYLPVGCDPAVHAPVPLSADEQERFGSDLSFLGAGYNNRRQMFATLVNYDFKIWGTEWPDCLPFDRLVQEKGRRLEPEEYVKIFNASKINLNLHSSMERDGVEPFGDFVNPRTFELAAAGAFQLTDGRTLLPPMFEYGKELAIFNDRKELVEQIDYFLAHPDERSKFTEAARKRALSEHTYRQRIQTMLEHVFVDHYDSLKSRADRGPWPATLDAAKKFPELEPRFKAAHQRGDEPTLNSLIADITTGKGALTEVEQKLLFLHHVRAQITNVTEMREGKKAG